MGFPDFIVSVPDADRVIQLRNPLESIVGKRRSSVGAFYVGHASVPDFWNSSIPVGTLKHWLLSCSVSVIQERMKSLPEEQLECWHIDIAFPTLRYLSVLELGRDLNFLLMHSE
jgi:hypothetical protein